MIKKDIELLYKTAKNFYMCFSVAEAETVEYGIHDKGRVPVRMYVEDNNIVVFEMVKVI